VRNCRETASAAKRKRPGREPSLRTAENIERLFQAFVRSPPLAGNVLTTWDATSQTLYSESDKGCHLTDTIFRK